MILRPSAAHGHEPTSSMGDDTALPLLSGPWAAALQLLPPALRAGDEPGDRPHPRALRHVARRRCWAGARRCSSRRPEARPASSSTASSSTPRRSASSRSSGSTRRSRPTRGSPAACARLGDVAEAAVRDGHGMLLLTDVDASPERPPVPMLLATVGRPPPARRGGPAHDGDARRRERRAARDAPLRLPARLRRRGDRAAARAADGRVARGQRPARQRPARRPAEAQARYRKSIEDGVLKVMSKMGISDVASYCGAQIFDALGLDHELVETAFPGTASHHGRHRPRRARGRGGRASGVGRACPPAAREPGLRQVPQGRRAARDEPGRRRRAAGGRQDERTWKPRTRCGGGALGDRQRLRHASRSSSTAATRSSCATCSSSLPAEPVPLDEVEPAEEIVRRFSSGGMSLGALSPEAHEAIAEAFNNLGARSNCGEGGEDPGALPHRAQLEDQADRLGPLRRHRRVRGLRRGAADQDRAGLEAGRGRSAARPQGHGRRSRGCGTRSPASR